MSNPLALGIVLFVAAVIRLIYWMQLRTFDPFYIKSPPHFDMHTYTAWGFSIANGDWSSAAFTAGKPFFYGPLYPYMLGAFFTLFGKNFDLLHLFQGLLGVAVPAAVWDITRRLMGRAEALVAGLLAAVTASVIFYEQVLLMEGLLLVVHSGILWMIITAATARRPVLWFAAAGLLSGLAVVGRSNYLLLMPLIALGIYMSLNGRSFTFNRSAGARAGIYLVAGILVLMIAFLRNYIVSGQPVLTTANGPMNLYIGNASDASGILDLPPSYMNLVKQYGSDDKVPWSAALWTDIKQHPMNAVGLYFKKLYLIVNAYDPADNVSYYLYRSRLPTLKWNPVDWMLLLPLAALGMWVTRGEARRRWPLYIYVFLFPMSLALVFVLGRYKLPIYPVLCCWSGAGVMFLVRSVRAHNMKVLVPAMLFLFAVAALVRPGWSPALTYVPETGKREWVRSNDYNNLAQGLIERGDLDAAHSVLAKGIVAYPATPELLSKYANVCIGRGRPAEAVPALENFIRMKGPVPAATALLERCRIQERGEGLPSPREF